VPPCGFAFWLQLKANLIAASSFVVGLRTTAVDLDEALDAIEIRIKQEMEHRFSLHQTRKKILSAPARLHRILYHHAISLRASIEGNMMAVSSLCRTTRSIFDDTRTSARRVALALTWSSST
jgi:hypothetical protein